MKELSKFNKSAARIMLIFVLAVFIFNESCTQKEKYSCNPQLNEWIIKNKAKYASITRDELAQIMSIDTQGVIYVSLPAEIKYQIWKAKFTLARDSMGLNDADRAHINTAINYFKPEYWESNESLDHYRIWADQWASDALQNLGWDSTKLFLIAETWLMPDELQAIADRYNNNPKVEYRPEGGENIPDCGCRYSISCQWFVESCSDGDGCNAAYECGISGSARCTGRCVDAASTLSNPNNPPTESTYQAPVYYVH